MNDQQWQVFLQHFIITENHQREIERLLQEIIDTLQAPAGQPSPPLGEEL